MRPKSIRLFDSLFVAGIVLGLVNIALGLTVLGGPNAAPLSERVASGGVSLVGINVFAAVIALTLWYLVSRLRIAVLRWVIALLVITGIAFIPAMFANGITPSVLMLVLASILQAAALYFLFRPESRAWFAARES